MIHVIGDFIQSVGVLIAAIILWMWPEYTIIDPLCTFLFSILVIFTTFPIARDCMNVFTNSTPHGIKKIDVLNQLRGIDEVVEVRSLKIISLKLGSNILMSGIIEVDLKN